MPSNFDKLDLTQLDAAFPSWGWEKTLDGVSSEEFDYIHLRARNTKFTADIRMSKRWPQTQEVFNTEVVALRKDVDSVLLRNWVGDDQSVSPSA